MSSGGGHSAMVLKKGHAWQRGSALIVALLMLTAILMLGTSAVQIALQEEKASRNGRDRLIALQAAEAALDDAVRDIEYSPRRHLFKADYQDDLAGGCAGAEHGLYRGVCRNAAERAPVWQMAGFPDDERSPSVPYGHFTERHFPSGTGMSSARAPRYVIEVMEGPATAPGAQPGPAARFVRITAIGFGVRDSTRVVVQSFYRQHSDGSAESVPGRLFGWREIANWEELRNADTDE